MSKMKEGWEYKKFEEVFDLQMGKTPSRDNPSYWGNGNNWVSIADLKTKYIDSTKEEITNVAVEESGIKLVPKGTVIMSFKLSVGKSAIAKKDLYTNEAIMAFHPKDDNVLMSDYVYYYLTGYKWKGANKAVMGMTLNKKSISSNTFAYPSITEQKHIVSELDLLSGVIEKQKAQLEELDKLAQSIFYDMFGDPVTNDKDWAVIQLGDKCEVTSFKRVLIEEVVEEGIPFIRGTELTALSKMTNSENYEFSLFITPDHYERVKAISGVPSVGDLLIPSINADGNIWILDTSKPRYFKDGRVLWVHVNHDVYTSSALKYIMQVLLKDTYSDMASGATFAELKLFVLRELKIILPPLSLQQEFAAKIEAIEAMKAKVRQSLKEAETLFNERMDYYFN